MCHCERAMELISLGLDGMLTPEERAELDEHLNSCTACGALARELEELRQLMPEEVEVPEDFHAGVMDRVRREKVTALDTACPKKKYNPWKSLGAMAAVFAVVLIGAGSFQHWNQLSDGDRRAGQPVPTESVQPTLHGVPDGAEGPETEKPEGAQEIERTSGAAAGESGGAAAAQAQMEQEGPVMADAQEQGADTVSPSQTSAPVEQTQTEAKSLDPVQQNRMAPRTAVEPQEGEPAADDSGTAPKIAPFSVGIAPASMDHETVPPELPAAAVENAVTWLAESELPGKDAVDAGVTTAGALPEDMLSLVVSLEGAEGLLDSSDWLITLGDTAGADYVQVVCDSGSNEVIGYLMQE